MDPKTPEPIDYYTPRPRYHTFLSWFRLKGPDSFLASAALLFSIIPFAFFIAGLMLANFDMSACFTIPVCSVGIVLSIAALCERDTSKLFPAIAMALSSFQLFLLVVISRLR